MRHVQTIGTDEMGLRDSFWAALGRDDEDSYDVVLERVRRAMLAVVEEYGGEDHYRLDMKISFAADLAELWHLRPDLMQVVAQTQGEEVAQDCVARITALFDKFQLGGSSSRFGGL